MSVTIRDVAVAAQTSAATVSKVMNGSGSISQATIDRVEQAMRDWIPSQCQGPQFRQAVHKDGTVFDNVG